MKPFAYLPVGLFLTIFFSFTLSGCKESPDEQTAVREPSREISLYHYFSGDLSGGIEDMIETVNTRQKDQRVSANALDHEAFKTMIHSTLDKGSPPELFTYWAGARTQTLVDRGQLEPLDDIWLQAGLDRLYPEPIVAAASTYNGRKYLVPITQHLVVFFYNKEIFTRENLVPPRNWQEFLALCNTLTERNITALALGARERWPAQFWFDYLLLRTAGPDYRAALMKGEASYSDPEVVEVYRLWAELIQQGYFNNDANTLGWAEATEMVCQGEAAVTLMGTWALQHFSGETCQLEAATDYDFFPFPLMKEGQPHSSVGPIDGIVLTQASSHHMFAKSVLAYFSEPESQQLMSLGSGALAPSNAVPKTFYSPFKQRLFSEIEKTERWAFNYDLATPPLVADKGMDSFAELIAYPDQYRAILRNLEQEAASLFGAGSTESKSKNASRE